MGKLLVMTKRARQVGREVWDKGDRSISFPLAIDLTSQAQEIYEQFRNALVDGWDEARMEEWRLSVSMGLPFVASTYHGVWLGTMFIYLPLPRRKWVGKLFIGRPVDGSLVKRECCRALPFFVPLQIFV